MSTDYANFFHIIVETVGSFDIFDRGLAWIQTEMVPPRFSFTLMGHSQGWAKNMDEDLKGMLKRSHSVLNDLVAGMIQSQIVGALPLK